MSHRCSKGEYLYLQEGAGYGIPLGCAGDKGGARPSPKAGGLTVHLDHGEGAGVRHARHQGGQDQAPELHFLQRGGGKAVICERSRSKSQPPTPLRAYGWIDWQGSPGGGWAG
jgi:hypothetical protein